MNDLTALLFKNWNEVKPYESPDSQVLWTWPAISLLRPAGKWVPEFICTLFPWQIILLFSHSWFAFILLANDRLRQSDLLSLCYTANAPQLGLFLQWQSIFALYADRKIDWEFNARELAVERFIKRDFLICDIKKLHYVAKILPRDTWKPNLRAQRSHLSWGLIGLQGRSCCRNVPAWRRWRDISVITVCLLHSTWPEHSRCELAR